MSKKRVCKKCHLEKDESHFYKTVDGKSLKNVCKECIQEYNKRKKTEKGSRFRDNFTARPGSYGSGSVAEEAVRGEIDGDLLEWILALDVAQRQKGRSLRKSEMFEVLLSLGYKKMTAPPV